jgi:hypothetical protein
MRDTNDLFFQATKGKFRFPSKVGELTTEQLWDLPLTSGKNGPDLDTVAKTINAEIRAASEESFVGPPKNSKRAMLETKLEVVKAIIVAKITDAREAEKRASKASRRKLLEEAIAQADMREINNAPRDELLKRLQDMDAED